MSAVSRAFLAVYPPPDVLDALHQRLVGLGRVDGVRWVPRDQWHVTLRFCGRVPDADALAHALDDELAAVPPVVGLQLVGAGAFPKPRHGSAFWVGFADGEAATALASVAAAVEAACVAAGLAPDDRGFRLHMTVGRRSRAGDLRPVVTRFGDDPVGPPWTADEIRLVASDTRSTGAVHTEVTRVPLSGRMP